MQLLQPCIDLGLDENKFWDMTLAEVDRWAHGALWRLKAQVQNNYILADLIGISVARIMSKDVKLPAVEDIYPDLFGKPKAVETKTINNKSVNNFLAQAMAINTAKRKAKERNGGEQA